MSSQKPGAARATVAGHPVTILREWTFSELPCKSQYFGFRVSGKLVQHPSVDEKFFGLDWNSTEIRGIHSNRVLISSNSSLYQLEGPPVPSSELSSIMEPFCQSTWPSDAQSRLREVSKIFGVDMSPQNGDIVLPQRRTRQSFNLGLRTRQSSNLGLDISPQNGGTPAERRNSARQAAAENGGTPAERRYSARQAAARADKAGEEDEAERVDMSPQNGDVLLLQRRTRQSSNLGLDMSPQNGGSSNKMQLFAT